VTSLNFGNSPFRVQQGPVFFGGHHRNGRGFDNRGFGNRGFVNPFFGSVVAVPYPVYVMEPGIDDSMEQVQQMEPEDYRGGLTIFDRRGSGTQEYSRPVPQRRREEAAEEEDYRTRPAPEPAPQQEAAEQPRTLLVFKDGHQREVANYAIVGPTLYDLSKGRSQKVALAELDLPATVKQNDQRGVEFQLPMASRAD
jgi:hypothetical protein